MTRSLPALLGSRPAAAALVLALGLALATTLGAAAPASAAGATLDDPVGDTWGPGLDLTSATLRNLDHRLVVEGAVDRAVRGDLVVSVDPRHATGVRLVSKYRPQGHTHSFVLAGAFSDGGDGRSSRVTCRGFRVRWSEGAPTARLVMPARCLDHGRYGALRFAVLTERGSDTDWAPDGAAASPWVMRG